MKEAEEPSIDINDKSSQIKDDNFERQKKNMMV